MAIRYYCDWCGVEEELLQRYTFGLKAIDLCRECQERIVCMVRERKASLYPSISRQE